MFLHAASHPPVPGVRHGDRTRVRRRTAAPQASRGQALVEFSLVLPLFLTVMLGILEFGFAFNAVLAVNFASRNAALTAAEGGDAAGTDCLILRSVENDIGAPADRNLAQLQVDGGLVYRGLIPTRDWDTLAFAVSHLGISDDIRHAFTTSSGPTGASPISPSRSASKATSAPNSQIAP